jgi:putative sterol carrier protein
VKRIASGLPRQTSIRGFLNALPLVFQRRRAKDLNATYHFTFTGREEVKSTVVIANKTLRVREGHEGKADLSITADSETWLRFLRKETALPLALLMRRVRLKGSPRLLLAFGRCFPT